MSMIDITDTERRIAERVDQTIAGTLGISSQSGGLAFTNAGEAMEFSKMMAVSQIGVRKHLRGNVGACLAITVQAIEWGMSPFAVANKSYLVNDQIAYESQLIQAVVLKRAPIKGRFKFAYSGDGDRRKCKVTATLTDGETVEYESPEIGKIPVKNSPLWKNDPDQQLSYYSGRAMCRRHFPDVLLGVYDIDELPQIESDETRAKKARDVTPARTLAGRLDALAGGADPETGEIIESGEADKQGAALADQPSPATETGESQRDTGSPEAAGEAAASSVHGSDTPAAEPFGSEMTQELTLLVAAREKAMEGKSALDHWINRLRPAQIDALSPHMKSLSDMAKGVAKKAAAE